MLQKNAVYPAAADDENLLDFEMQLQLGYGANDAQGRRKHF